MMKNEPDFSFSPGSPDSDSVQPCRTHFEAKVPLTQTAAAEIENVSLCTDSKARPHVLG